MNTQATPVDIDAMLAKASTEDLVRIVERAGALPLIDWRQMTAEQRRAMRAQNLLARRQQAAQRAQGDSAEQAERQAVAARQLRELKAARELDPYIERKRREYSREW